MFLGLSAEWCQKAYRFFTVRADSLSGTNFAAIIEVGLREMVELSQRKRYPNFRNVTARQEHGRLVVEVSPVSNYGSYVFGLLLTSGVFLWWCWIFATMILRANSKADFLTRGAYSLPVIAFLCMWFLIGARIILQRLSSIELSAGEGVFKWTQRTFHWAKEISVREEDVTAVIEDARWYSKTLKLTVNGKIYALHDLLEDDLTLIARQLRARLGIPNPPVGR